MGETWLQAFSTHINTIVALGYPLIWCGLFKKSLFLTDVGFEPSPSHRASPMRNGSQGSGFSHNSSFLGGWLPANVTKPFSTTGTHVASLCVKLHQQILKTSDRLKSFMGEAYHRGNSPNIKLLALEPLQLVSDSKYINLLVSGFVSSNSYFTCMISIYVSGSSWSQSDVSSFWLVLCSGVLSFILLFQNS